MTDDKHKPKGPNVTPKLVLACDKALLRINRFGQRDTCNCDRDDKRFWRKFRLTNRIMKELDNARPPRKSPKARA